MYFNPLPRERENFYYKIHIENMAYFNPLPRERENSSFRSN